MRLPVDVQRLTVIAIGEPQPQHIFGSDEPKTDKSGRPLFRLPVLLVGTGERVDPTSTITLPGPIVAIPNGATVKVRGLTATTWTVRGQDGRERSGLTLRAEAVETATAPRS